MTRPTSNELERFLAAQASDEAGYESAMDELRQGAKVGHWIWYILPQLRRLGRSETARYYGLEDVEEAVAYLRHPTLAPRYAATVAVIHDQLCGKRVAPLVLMGSEIDLLKLRSSLELFVDAAADGPTGMKFVGQAREILEVLREGVP
jgi:uncharacterized protein (DUF1810 family)